MSSRTKNGCPLSRAWQACSSPEEPITCSASVIKSQAVVQGPGGCHKRRSMLPSARSGASSRSVPRALRRQVDREQRPGSPPSVVCEQRREQWQIIPEMCHDTQSIDLIPEQESTYAPDTHLW